MSKTIITLEGNSILASDDLTVVTVVAKMAIDDDGSGPNHGDPDEQPDTSLHYEGQPLNADLEPYGVVPESIIGSVPGIWMGCQGFAMYQGKCVAFVAGDKGPRTKIGEGSIALAKMLGIPSSPTEGGVDCDVVWTFFPGTPATTVLLDGTTRTYALLHS